MIRDVQRAKKWLESISEILTEWGVAFDEAATSTCYVNTFLQKELLAGAKEFRHTAHKKTVDKMKEELKKAEEKKDQKTAATITKKLEALESSCAPLQNGGCSITRVMDCSTRCTLKSYDMTSVDIEGKNLHDMAETLRRAFGRGQFLTDRLHMHMIIAYIDPDNHMGHIKHRQQQEALHSRVGSILYVSPEICNNSPYGAASDVWSLGCIVSNPIAIP